MSSVAEAIAALRAGRPVRIGRQAFLPIETGSDELLAVLDPSESASVLLSAERAAALRLTSEREAASGPAIIARCAWLDRDMVRALADPGRDLSRLTPGPLTVLPLERPEETQAALTLARLAGLLPALWLVQSDTPLHVEPDEVAEAVRRQRAVIASRARLPLDGVQDAQIIAFRVCDDGSEHVALMVGAPGGRPPLVRLHSECLTGDVFGSLKCDCGPQLRSALRLIADGEGGILLYLRDEGRGIGLANKIRAYALQDRGLDTVDANRRLGFADDARDYGLAAAMLRALGVEAVRLLTNNPAKVAGLTGAGIEVVERVPHRLPPNPHNAAYLAAKRTRSGHLD
ncbi:GTP cyclohydrolase II [Sphingomonas sp. GCM10030256]|uniref:GTP cyclohydrolase II n=1 Tax=Sphingomonas sp. GCM10030256 TaxID=3273427 RepID=UPI003616F989